MNYLIRFITENAAGSLEHSDKVVEAPVITIGRATDQVLHLKDRRARLQHAVIEQQGEGARITTNALTGIVVNGRSQRSATLKVGDVIEVGSNILRVIDAPDGINFAITFELCADASGSHLVQNWTAPVSGIGGWSKRRLSWTLVTLVAISAMALPSFYFEDLRLAGPVHSAHSSIASECESCHVKEFQRVPDTACVECHKVDRHVAQGQPVLGEIRCASCHLEHNEPAELVNRHQALCSGCHADLADDVALENAEDFLDAHPEFRISLLQMSTTADDDVEWSTDHLSMSDAQGAEHSNLIFNHAVHLDEAGIVTPEGRRVIECADCHQPQPGGAQMQPIVMDEHCSGCHTLNFDPDNPSREIPHGDPASVIQALVEYYSARLLGADPDEGNQRVRRPGRALTRTDRDRAAAEARKQALTVAADLFERRACTTCHDVTRVDDDSDVPWKVLPVRLTENFFVHASFSHSAHETEVSSCDGCHQAARSEAATDVLIPGIESCRACHGSGSSNRNSSAQIPSTCVMCHSFHFDGKGTHP